MVICRKCFPCCSSFMRFFETEQSTCHLLYPFYAVHGLLFHLKHKHLPTWLPSWKKSLGVIILSWIDYLKINFNTPTCDLHWLPGSRLPVYTARNEDGVGCGSRNHWKGFFTSKAPWPDSLFLLRLCCTWEAALVCTRAFLQPIIWRWVQISAIIMNTGVIDFTDPSKSLGPCFVSRPVCVCVCVCVRACVCILVHPDT